MAEEREVEDAVRIVQVLPGVSMDVREAAVDDLRLGVDHHAVIYVVAFLATSLHPSRFEPAYYQGTLRNQLDRRKLHDPSVP